LIYWLLKSESFVGNSSGTIFSLVQNKLQKSYLREVLGWYLELRKYGSLPSFGSEMGFERFLQLILGIPNMKDTVPFP
jgi:asparaginyl-tRNA synthetase